MNRSFRQALAWAGLLMLVSLVAMGVALGVGLKRADHLLDRLGRSQDQLARVTRIEADINALLVDISLGVGRGGSRDEAVADIERQLREYQRSILAEQQVLGAGAEAAAQAGEARNAETLAALFQALKTDLPLAQGVPAGPPNLLQNDLRRFYGLAQALEAGERQEAVEAIEAMRRLRLTTTWVGVGVPLIVAVLGAAGAWLMLAGMVRPLRALEAAAARAGRGERPAPVNVRGFAEFEGFARAFTRMDEQIAAQRLALSQANEGLEQQVQARTREIEASHARLAEIDRTRRLFFSKISHELRTPATVIRGEAEVALRDSKAPPERLREALEHVVANGAFLQRRLDDLLALARAEDGRVAMRREAVDLVKLVQDAVDLAEPYARSSGVELVAELPAGVRPVVTGDASWLQQALLALVDNAAKFSGGAEAIRFSLRMDEGVARIAVADGGPGADPSDLPFLFESYYQAPAGAARGGAGLGLSIARWVAEQHGGEISAQNIPGSGLVVEMRLPVAA